MSKINNGTANLSSQTGSLLMEYPTYESVKESADYLLHRTKIRPKIGIICGTGMGTLANSVKNADIFSYEDIPHFPLSTVASHAGKMLFGFINDVPVMCMQGRFHYYEGYPLSNCSMPVRVMKLCGCTHLIASNAAGALNTNYKVGDIMIVKDHINVMGIAGIGPLVGPYDPRFGPRFTPMTYAYDPNLVKTAQIVAQELAMADEVQTGIYTCVGGPNYETVAELRMLKQFGLDAVGMSTVHEVITARQCDMKSFAFSLITNVCSTEYDTNDNASHDDVVTIGLKRQENIAAFVTRMVEEIGYLDDKRE